MCIRHLILGLLLLATCAGGVNAEEGRPLPRVATAYIYNNTDHEISFTVSSSKGSVSVIVPSKKRGKFEFVTDGKHRALTAFYTSNGNTVTNRYPPFKPGLEYDVYYVPKKVMEMREGMVFEVELPEEGRKPGRD